MAHQGPPQKPVIHRLLPILLTLSLLSIATPIHGTHTAAASSIYVSVDGRQVSGAVSVTGVTVVDVFLYKPHSTTAPQVSVVVDSASSGTAVTLEQAREYTTTPTGDIPWVGRIVLGESNPTNILGQFIQLSATSHTIDIEHGTTHTGPGTITWTPGNTAKLEVITPDSLDDLDSDVTYTFYGDATQSKISLYVDDEDVTIPTASGNGAACPTLPAYSVMIEDRDGNLLDTGFSCEIATRGTSGSVEKALNLTTLTSIASASVDDRETFTFHLVDPNGDDGKATLVSGRGQYIKSADVTFEVVDPRTGDTVSPATGTLLGSGATYTIRATDTDSNANPSLPDTLTVRVETRQCAATCSTYGASSTLVQGLSLNLAETGADTGEFQGNIVITTSPSGGNHIRVPSGGTNEVRLFVLSRDDRMADGTLATTTSPVASAGWKWEAREDSVLRVKEADGTLVASTTSETQQLNLFGTSSVDPLEIGADDADGFPARAIVRTAAAQADTCHPDANVVPSSASRVCVPVTLASGDGTFFIEGPGTFPSTSMPQALPNQGLFVDVLDADAESGAMDVRRTVSMVWKETFDGVFVVDHATYPLEDPIPVAVYDPDPFPRAEVTINAKAGTTDLGDFQLSESSTIDGLYTGTIDLSGSFSGSQGNGVTITLGYFDTREADGDENPVGSTPSVTKTIQVIRAGTGLIRVDEANLLDEQTFKVTVTDDNVDDTVEVPHVTAKTNYNVLAEPIWLDEGTNDRWTADVMSDVFTVEEAVTAVRVDGDTVPNLGDCYLQLPLSNMPLANAVVLDDGDNAWTADATPATNARQFAYDFARSRLLIDLPEDGTTQACTNPSAIQSQTEHTIADDGDVFTITYTPAPEVVERFRVTGGTGSVTLNLMEDLYGSGTVTARPPDINFTAAVAPAPSGASTTTEFLLQDGDETYADGDDVDCVATVNGNNAPCDITDGAQPTVNVNPTGNVPVDALVEVRYFVNNLGTQNVPTSATTLDHGPVVMGSVMSTTGTHRYDPIPFSSTAPGGLGADGTLTLDAADLVDEDGDPRTTPIVVHYLTQLLGDHRVSTNESFVDGEGDLVLSYPDPDDANGAALTTSETIDFFATHGIDGITLTEYEQATQYHFGKGTNVVVRVTAGHLNQDSEKRETLKVDLESAKVDQTGVSGTALETDDLTLTETGVDTGVFEATTSFVASVADDGKISTGSESKVQVTFTVRGTDRSFTAWWFDDQTASLTVDRTALRANGDSTRVELRDRDPSHQVVNLRSSGIISGNNVAVVIPPALVPVVDSSIVVYACVVGTDVCRALERDEDYTFTASTGTITVHITGGERFGVHERLRADFRVKAAGSADVKAVIKDDIGRIVLSDDIALPETSSTSGVFRATVTFTGGVPDITGTTITLRDDYTATFYSDDARLGCIGGTFAAPCTLGAGLDAVAGGLSYPGVKSATVTWQETTSATLKIVSDRLTTAATDVTLFGSEEFTIRVTDTDRDADPLVQDIVSVTLSGTGSSSKTVTLRETAADSGVFEADLTMNTASAVTMGDGGSYDVSYRDPHNAAGSTATLRLRDGFSVDERRWFNSEKGRLQVFADVLAADSTVLVRVTDQDRNQDAATRETLPGGDFSFCVDTSADQGRVPLSGGACVAGTGMTETGVDTGVFEAFVALGAAGLGLSGTAAAENFLRISYTDPYTTLGTAGLAAEVRHFVPADAGVPELSNTLVTKRDETVTVTVRDVVTHSGGDVVVDIFVDTLDQSPDLTLPLTASSGLLQATFGFESDDTDGIEDLSIQFEQDFHVVYRDDSAYSGAPVAPFTAITTGRLTTLEDPLTSVATIVGTADGFKDWFVASAPDVTITLADGEDSALLDHFEYQVGAGGTIQSCPDPCTFTVATEGVNVITFYSVANGDVFESPQTLEVKYDATPPTLTARDVTATPIKDGKVRLEWNATESNDPKEFGGYVVYRDGKTSPVEWNITTKTFDDDPGDETQHKYYIGIMDEAGNLGPVPESASAIATPDDTAPQLATFTVDPEELSEEAGETTVNFEASLETADIADTDKVIVRVVDPFGATATEVDLTQSGTDNLYTGSFSDFNVSGTWTMVGAAVDLVGNEGTITRDVAYRGIDRAAPQVNVPATVARGAPLSITVTDNDKGIATISYTLDGGAAVTVPVTGNPTTHTFTVSTAALTIGEHSIVLTVADANGTANQASYTRTFEVTAPDGGPGTPTPTAPQVQAVRTLVQSGGALRVAVTSTALTGLTASIDGGAVQDILSTWSVTDPIAEVDLTGVTAGEHEVTITATNAVGPTERKVTIFVLDSAVPLPPETVVVRTNSDGKPVVEWTASPSSNVEGYLVHRASSPFKVIARLGPDATSYTDESAADGKEYRYAVTAFGANGQGDLAVGDDSEDLPWFGHVQSSGVTVSEPDGGLGAFWWVFLVLLVVIVAISLAYVYRERLFGPKGEELYDDEYPDEADTAAPFGAEHHAMRCPNCTHEFSVAGQKPIVTTCPNCGKKGILR